MRAQLRRWLPELRTLFVMRVASLKYRLRVPGFDVPEDVRRRQEAYDEICARTLERMADRIDSREHSKADQSEQSPATRKDVLRETESEARRELPSAQAASFVALLDAIDVLTTSLAGGMEKDFAP